MAVHEVVVHGRGDDLGNGDRLELHESVMLGAAGDTVPRETQTSDLAEL